MYQSQKTFWHSLCSFVSHKCPYKHVCILFLRLKEYPWFSCMFQTIKLVYFTLLADCQMVFLSSRQPVVSGHFSSLACRSRFSQRYVIVMWSCCFMQRPLSKLSFWWWNQERCNNHQSAAEKIYIYHLCCKECIR